MEGEASLSQDGDISALMSSIHLQQSIWLHAVDLGPRYLLVLNDQRFRSVCVRTCAYCRVCPFAFMAMRIYVPSFLMVVSAIKIGGVVGVREGVRDCVYIYICVWVYVRMCVCVYVCMW